MPGSRRRPQLWARVVYLAAAAMLLGLCAVAAEPQEALEAAAPPPTTPAAEAAAALATELARRVAPALMNGTARSGAVNITSLSSAAFKLAPNVTLRPVSSLGRWAIWIVRAPTAASDPPPLGWRSRARR
jgi:hypothetical protein